MPVTLIEGRNDTRTRVLIAGGGVAALEALLALSETAGRYVELELLAPGRELTYRPMAVADPFGLAEAHALDLQRVASERGAHLRVGTLQAIEPENRVAITRAGERIEWDALLVAIGTRQTPWLDGALSFGGPRDVPAYRDLLAEIASGTVRRLAFVIPRGPRWGLPLYELALMTAAHAAAHNFELAIEIVTPERRPLELFGPAVSAHVERLLADSGITIATRVVALATHSGCVIFAPSGAVKADRVVALPQLSVPHIPGLPQKAEGFIPVDEFCRVEGCEHVYAAGDATWHGIKQGGIATQQADTAASAIAAAAGAPVTPHAFEPVLRGILLTGGAPEYLRVAHGKQGEVSEDALWWPPAKVVGRYLAPLLADTSPDLPLHDGADDHHPALDLALEAATAAVTCSEDYATGLRWLDVAERINVVLPVRYAQKRAEWRQKLTARAA